MEIKNSSSKAGVRKNEGLAAKAEAKINELADKTANAAAAVQREVQRKATQGGDRLQEAAHQAGHRAQEVTTKAIHSAQETAQKVVHRAKEAVTAAELRFDELSGETVEQEKKDE
jgi:hypothetical protein